MTNPDYDHPTRKDIEDVLVEIEEMIQMLRGRGTVDVEDNIRNLEEQAARLKQRLINW